MQKPERYYQHAFTACNGDPKLLSPAFEFCMAFRDFRAATADYNKAPTEGGWNRLRTLQERMDEAWSEFDAQVKRNTEVLIGPPVPEPKSLWGTDAKKA